MTRGDMALNRFGLGTRMDETLPDDPARWLLNQLEQYQPKPAAYAAAPTTAQVTPVLIETVKALRQSQRAKRMADNPSAAHQEALVKSLQEGRSGLREVAINSYTAHAAARANTALTTRTPFLERLVQFWSNHFAVSIDKLPLVGLAGPFEQEAIRPHVLGRFADMLLAAERHPAMMVYLDQVQSVGPNSALVRRVADRVTGRTFGLNENLAREILELHTLGVKGGYSQADVSEFARAMTGWTVGGLLPGKLAHQGGDAPSRVLFVDLLHEPGPRTVLGKRYPDRGGDTATAILKDLAAHPSTAQFVSAKLVRHFLGDAAPAALIDAMAKTFLRTGGDLPSLYRMLVDAPEAWTGTRERFRSPWLWTIASLRATGTQALDGKRIIGALDQLGQPLWKPGSPAGWPDDDSTWAGPDALYRRVEVAQVIASQTRDRIDTRTLAPRLLPGAVSAQTARVIASAESPQMGVALLLVSPEFLRC